MRHNTIISKIFLTLLLFGMVLWLGGSIVRMSTAYDIYKPFSNMELKIDYPDSSRFHTVKLFSFGALYTSIGFSAAFFGYILTGFYFRRYLKNYGWMFIALALFIISAPWGFYEMYLDLKLYFLVQDRNLSFDYPAITDLFVSRFSKLTVWALISYLSAITSLLMVVWRPLQKYANKKQTDVLESEGGNE